MNPIQPSEIAALLQVHGLPDQPATVLRLTTYVALLHRWSGRINLLGPLAQAQLVEAHLPECFWLGSQLPLGGSWADLGSGAGLPGLVLACLWPEQDLWLYEARPKKARFLALAAQELGLRHLHVQALRVPAWDLSPDRPRHDLILSRATASLNLLLGLAASLVRPGGRLWCLKGPRLGKEMAEAEAETSLGPGRWALEMVQSTCLGGRQVNLARFLWPGG